MAVFGLVTDRRRSSPVNALFVVLLAVVGGYDLLHVRASYHDAMLAATQRVEANAAMLEQHVSRTFGEVDAALQSLGAGCMRDEDGLRGRLDVVAQRLPQLAAIAAFDAQGKLRAAGGPASLAALLRPEPQLAALSIGQAALVGAAAEARRTITLQVALADLGGHPCGSLVGFIDSAYLEQFARQVLGDGLGMVSLRRADGSALMRVPAAPDDGFDVAGRVVADAALGRDGRARDEISPVDGVARIVATRTLAQFPVILRYGLDRSAIVGAWWRHSTGLAVISLAFLVLLTVAWRRIGRQHAALADREERLDMAMRGADLGWWDWDIVSGRMVTNQRWSEMLGYAPGELLAHVKTWERMIHPDDRDRALTELAAHLRGDTPLYDSIHRVRHRQGHWVWVGVRGQVQERGPDGRALRASGTHLDITAYKRAEADLVAKEDRYRSVVTALGEGIVIRDHDGRIVEFNPAARAILGLGEGDTEALGQPFLDSRWEPIGPDGSPFPNVRHPAVRCLRDGIAVRDEIIGLRKPSGTVVWLSVNSQLLERSDLALRHDHYADGAVVTSFTDITARVLAEQEWRRSNAELEQFAYVASHDLRQPLRMINSYSTLLRRRLGSQLDAEAATFLGFILDGSTRMTAMLASLLDYSRVGRMGMPMAPMDAHAALEEALAFLRPAIAEAGAEISVAGHWPTITASADEMTRLCQNLVGNAVKYHAPGVAPRIEVRGQVVPEGWRLEVADNGIGIDPAQADRLFKVFQRLQVPTDYEGTGIGLAICRKIVERHGGRIWAESAGPGQGSRFVVFLPERNRTDPTNGTGPETKWDDARTDRPRRLGGPVRSVEPECRRSEPISGSRDQPTM